MRYILLAIISLSFTQILKTQTKDLVQQNCYSLIWNKNIDVFYKEVWLKHNQTSVKNKRKSQKRHETRLPDSSKLRELVNKVDVILGLHYHPVIKNHLIAFLDQKEKLEAALSYANILSESFEKKLEENDLPIALKNLPLVFTAMNNNYVGETGSAGLWQIMYANGRRQGLRIDFFIDERKDIKWATDVAIKELKIYFELYHNWELAIAAYFCGAANVNKAIAANNNTHDFYMIYDTLPEFCCEVVPAFTAMCLIERLPSSFNLRISAWDNRLALDSVKVSRQLHFKQIEEIMHIPVAEMRYINPEFIRDIIPAKKEELYILFPSERVKEFYVLEDSMSRFNDTVLFNLKMPVIEPPPEKERYYAKQSKLIPENSALLYYTIKEGDILGYIAQWYDVSVQQIIEWNNIYNPRKLKVGQKLKLYVQKDKRKYYENITMMNFEQKQAQVNQKELLSDRKKQNEKITSEEDFFWYVVKLGDSPYTIARKFPGVSADDIVKWNNIKDPKKLRQGQKLKIKKVK